MLLHWSPLQIYFTGPPFLKTTLFFYFYHFYKDFYVTFCPCVLWLFSLLQCWRKYNTNVSLSCFLTQIVKDNVSYKNQAKPGIQTNNSAFQHYNKTHNKHLMTYRDIWCVPCKPNIWEETFFTYQCHSFPIHFVFLYKNVYKRFTSRHFVL